MDELKSVVIDNGSGWIKAGFAGDEGPKAVFPTVVGKLKPQVKDSFVASLPNLKDTYVGEEAQRMRGILTMKHPINQGHVTDWESMESIWHHIFYNELSIAPEEHTVLLSEAALNPGANREKMTQLMFETFNTPAIHVNMAALWTLYAYGRTTGMVVESGYSMTDCVPIVNGFALSKAIIRFFLAGFDLTQYMQRITCEKNNEPILRDTPPVRDIKEQLCYVAMDFYEEIEKNKQTQFLKQEYTLPDDRVIVVDHERVQVPEAMFQPSFIGFESTGLREHIHQSIMRCDEDIRGQLYSDIILGGGNTLFPGMADRLQKEVTSCAPSGVKIRVSASPNRRFSAWNGGSLVPSLSSFKEFCVSKQEYDEAGPSIVNKKCI